MAGATLNRVFHETAPAVACRAESKKPERILWLELWWGTMEMKRRLAVQGLGAYLVPKMLER